MASLELPAISCICYPLFHTESLGYISAVTAQQVACVWCPTSKTHKKVGETTYLNKMVGSDFYVVWGKFMCT